MVASSELEATPKVVYGDSSRGGILKHTELDSTRLRTTDVVEGQRRENTRERTATDDGVCLERLGIGINV